MLRTSDVAPWLTGLSGWPSTSGVVVPVLPASFLGVTGYPDRAVFLAPTGGPGELLERAFDEPSYQFRFRGEQGDPQTAYDDTEALAAQVDDLLLSLEGTHVVGAHTLGLITRVGGPPAFLLRESQRVHFTGNYLFTASR